jgi:UDP-N-acetyl-D-galactosamine dehydrogenase
VTFKENVSDIRNSKVADMVHEFKNFSLHVDVVDPYAASAEVHQEYGFELIDETDHQYDAIVVAVAHDAYKEKDAAFFEKYSNGTPFVVDLKNLYTDKNLEGFYTWRL